MKPLLKEKDKKEKSHPLSWWRKTCDRLMQEVGRKRYPVSLISGQPTQVMHHFVPKSVSSNLRYDFDNLIPLTNAEHCRLHQSPDPTTEQMIRTLKGDIWWHKLRTRKQQIIKVNVEYYKQVKDALEIWKNA